MKQKNTYYDDFDRDHEHSPFISITGEPAWITYDLEKKKDIKPYVRCYMCGQKMKLKKGKWVKY